MKWFCTGTNTRFTLCAYSLFGSFGLLSFTTPLIAAPVIQQWTENEARIYFVAAPELPMVDIQVIFDAGAARDDLAGLAQLTNQLLESGTDHYDADAVAEQFDSWGVRLASGVNHDMAWLSMRSLTEDRYLHPAIDLFAQLLKAPAFTAESVARERQRAINAVKEGQQSPNYLAQQAFYQALYGTHPYASPIEGTEAGLQAINREHLQAFHRRYYVAANAVVTFVGAIDRQTAEQIAHRIVGQLPKGNSAPPLPPAIPPKQPIQIRLPHPSSQSHIYVGQLGMSRTDPDYHALFLANHILGGSGLISKLSEEIREKRGLAYSVYSYFSPLREAGPFLINLQTRHDQTEEALTVLKTTLATFRSQGPQVEEWEAARKNLTGGFALRIDSNSKISQYLAVIGFYQLPLDYLNTFTGKINALTLEQINQKIAERFHLEPLITVVVGGMETDTATPSVQMPTHSTEIPTAVSHH